MTQENISNQIKAKADIIVGHTYKFCKEHLDEGYAQLAREAVLELGYKITPSPLSKGSSKAWACGIIHALVSVNSLFDKKKEIYISVTNLCKTFEVSTSTSYRRSKTVRNFLNMRKYSRWCLSKSSIIDQKHDSNQTRNNSSNKAAEVKKYVIEHADEILLIIKNFQDVKIETYDENVLELIDSIKDSIKDQNDILIDEIEFLKKTEWERYTIAFFGETNAGKSTIIETLIGGDGTTIGDGQKDFTQKVVTYIIPDLPKILIKDMPGIEGDEEEFKEEIKKAVNQSHTLFYVIGTNKEPEEATVKKIKEYLQKQGEVYYIFNGRAKAGKYRRKKILFKSDDQELFYRINEKLKEQLGEHYKGSIHINAHLAFCVSASPKAKHFINDRKAYLQVFQNPDSAFEFSRFRELFDLIGKNYGDNSKRIITANISKFVNTINRIISSLEREHDTLEDIVNIDEVDKAIKKVYERFRKCNASIQSTVDEALNSFKTRLIEIANKGIDDSHKKEKLEQNIKTLSTTFQVDIERELKKLLKNLEYEIKQIFRELENRLELNMELNKISFKLNLDDILSKLTYNLKDVFKKVADLGLTLWTIIEGFLINPIVGIITAIVAIIDFFARIFKTGGEKKKDAKNKAYKQINMLVSNIRKKIDGNVLKEIKKAEENVEIELQKIRNCFKSMEEFKTSFKVGINEIKNICNDLSDFNFGGLS